MTVAAFRTAADEITVYMGSNLRTLDPHHAVTAAEQTAVNALHLGLTQYDPAGTIVPGLAESWDISDDGRIYTFTLKPGLTWSDGQPLAAEDVVAGFRRALNPSNPSPFAVKLNAIMNAEAYRLGTLESDQILGVSTNGPQTVLVSLARRDVDFLNVLAHPVAKPTPFRRPDAVIKSEMSSGAFSIGRWNDDVITLINETTHANLHLRVVESVEQVPVNAAQAERFLTSALPIVTAPEAASQKGIVQFDGGDALYAYAINTRRAPFDTLEVRHALAMAIIRSEVLSRTPVASAQAATQFVPPSAMTYEQPYRTPFAELTFEEREAVAAALLSERGYDLENRFSVRLRIPDGDIHFDIASTVATMWARSGIDTQIITSPLPEHWDALTTGDFDVAFVSWPGPRNSPRSFLEPLSRSGGPWNWPRYSFPDYSDQIERAAQSEMPDVRANQYREAEKSLIEDQSLLALFFYRPLALISPGVQGWQENGAGIHPLGTLSAVLGTSKPGPR